MQLTIPRQNLESFLAIFVVFAIPRATRQESLFLGGNQTRSSWSVIPSPALVYRVQEESAVGFIVGKLAEDIVSLLGENHRNEAMNENRRMKLTIINWRDNEVRVFSLDEQTNSLRIARPPDRETICPIREEAGSSTGTTFQEIITEDVEKYQLRKKAIIGKRASTTKCFVDLKIAYSELLNQGEKPTYDPGLITVRVEIQDINDHAPVFPQNRIVTEVGEMSMTTGSSVVSIPNAFDPDSGSNGTIYYWVELVNPKASKPKLLELSNLRDSISDDQEFPFEIRDKPLRIVLTDSLDWETQNKYNLIVHAQDLGYPESKKGQMNVQLIVRDENDNAPLFSQAEYVVVINENVKRGSTILEVTASDADSPANSQMTFSLSQPMNAMERDALQHFGLRTVSTDKATIYVIQPPDLDQKANKAKLKIDTSSLTAYQEFNFNITVRDNGYPHHLSSTAKIVIRVFDVNDFVPVISITYLDQYTSGDVGKTLPSSMNNKWAVVRENEKRSFIAFVSVIDRDFGPWGEVQCWTDNEALTLLQVGGENSFSTSLEEVSSSFETTGFSGTSSVQDDEKGFKLIAVKAFDREKTAEITAHIICVDNPPPLPNSNENFMKVALAYPLTTLTAPAQKIQLTGTSTIRIRVLDENDNAPVFEKNQYNFVVNEADGMDTATTLGKESLEFIGHVVATDADTTSKLSYTLANESDVFFLQKDTGKLFIRKLLDREDILGSKLPVELVRQNSLQMYVENDKSLRVVLPIMASDGKYNTTTTAHIMIRDLNDNTPAFENESYEFFVQENEQPVHQAAIGSVKAYDYDGTEIEYRLEDPYVLSPHDMNDSQRPVSRTSAKMFFAVGGRSGQIHLLRMLDREQQSQFIFHIIAIDNLGMKQPLTIWQSNSQQLLDPRVTRRLSVTTTVTVIVTDVNDNHPRISYPPSHDIINVESGAPAGHNLLTVMAEDPDAGENGTVQYFLSMASFGHTNNANPVDSSADHQSSLKTDNKNQLFAIDKTTGIIFLLRKLPESPTSHILVIGAHDLGSPNQRKVTTTVTIRVLNNRMPFNFGRKNYPYLVHGNQPLIESHKGSLEADRLIGDKNRLASITAITQNGLFTERKEGGINSEHYASKIGNPLFRFIPITDRTIVGILATIFSLLLLTTAILLFLIKRRRDLERERMRLQKDKHDSSMSNNAVKVDMIHRTDPNDLGSVKSRMSNTEVEYSHLSTAPYRGFCTRQVNCNLNDGESDKLFQTQWTNSLKHYDKYQNNSLDQHAGGKYSVENQDSSRPVFTTISRHKRPGEFSYGECTTRDNEDSPCKTDTYILPQDFRQFSKPHEESIHREKQQNFSLKCVKHADTRNVDSELMVGTIPNRECQSSQPTKSGHKMKLIDRGVIDEFQQMSKVTKEAFQSGQTDSTENVSAINSGVSTSLSSNEGKKLIPTKACDHIHPSATVNSFPIFNFLLNDSDALPTAKHSKVCSSISNSFV